MKLFFSGLFDCVKRKKGFCCFLVLLSLVSIVLGVLAVINFSSSNLTINLSHIAYIRFLAGGGFASMIFGLIMSLCVFLVAVILFCWKKFLYPLAILFYCYIIYSQTVVMVSIMLIYGVFNAIILLLLLLLYTMCVWFLFLLIMCELMGLNKQANYFKCCFQFKESKILVYILFLIVLCLTFAIILTILKKYVVLLIF